MSERDNNGWDAASAFKEEFGWLCASDSISEERLRWLFRHYQNYGVLNDVDYTFFHLLCANSRENLTEGIIRCVLEYLPDAFNAAEHSGMLPLHYSCIYNDTLTLGITQLLIDAAPDSIRHEDDMGRLPLHCLCGNRKIDETRAMNILKLLIEKHPESIRHANMYDGQLPLHYACDNDNMTIGVIQLLIDAAPDSVCHEDNNGYLPLHFVCTNKQFDDTKSLEILKLLLEKYPESIRHADHEGCLPIHLAATSSKPPEFCRLLIEAYPLSERMAGHEGMLPLHCACAGNTVATVDFLYNLYPDGINHSAPKNTGQWYPIHSALYGLNQRADSEAAVGIVKFLLGCDPRVKSQKVGGILPSLLMACSMQYRDSNIGAAIEVIKAIYDVHPDEIELVARIMNIIDIHDHELDPLNQELMNALMNRHPSVQAFINNELVYSHQAKDHLLMTTPDHNGQLPLHTALRNNVRLGSIKLLVEGHPPAVLSPDNCGALPLHIACAYHESASVVQHLVELDATTLEALDEDDNTALHYACRGAKYETIALLLEKYDAVSVSKRNAQEKLPMDLLWESTEVIDRDSVEYTGSIFQLVKAYPEIVMSWMKYEAAGQVERLLALLGTIGT